MTGQHTGSVEPREDVAYVCGQLERIRATLEAHSPEGASPLARVLTALHNGEDPSESLSALHEALLVAGDAAGIRGGTRSVSPLGVNSVPPDEWVLLCPTGQCSRFSWPDSSGTALCRISGHPLRKERL